MPEENVIVKYARELYSSLPSRSQDDTRVYLGNVEGKLNLAHLFNYILEQALKTNRTNAYEEYSPEHSIFVVFNGCIFGFAHALVSSVDNLAMVIYRIYNLNHYGLSESATDMESIWQYLQQAASGEQILDAVRKLRCDLLYQFIRDLRNDLSHHYMGLGIAGPEGENFFDLRISMREPRNEYRNLLKKDPAELLREVMNRCKGYLESIIDILNTKIAAQPSSNS
jgi:hypothetical protein